MFAPIFSRPLTVLLALAGIGAALDVSPDIRVNQIGYLPSMPKVAVLSHAGADSAFSVIREPGGESVHEGFGQARRYWSSADDTAQLLDFSALTTPGTYRIKVAGKGVSHPFVVSKDAFQAVTKAAIKSYYFQRSSSELLPAHAGIYARPAGHPDTAVRVHNSAATTERKANSLIRSPKGWYDAGDYGKYIVNSGITVWTILDAYLSAPSYFDTLDLNIPESGNELPDVLDEALWNIDWMLTMQDLDGGVYHKLSTPGFPGFVMPAADRVARYVVKKTTAATLDFAAVMAQTSRVFRRFEAQRPGFADSCLTAAIRAWEWAQANPKIVFKQDSLRSPSFSTGTYADGSLTDEKQWAAVELTLATGRDSFWIAAFPGRRFAGAKSIPAWPDVSALGLMSAFTNMGALAGFDTTGMSRTFKTLAEEATYRLLENPYGVPVEEGDMYWGSTAVTGNVALTSLKWYLASRDTSFRNAALAAVDWILGRNALGVSLVTGFGAVSPQKPHHRPSGADSIAAPIPGFVVGGPNNGREDEDACAANDVEYPSALPALAWVDAECSYASNEVAINWNAPLVALLGILQAGELRDWVSVAPRSTRPMGARVTLARHGSGFTVASLDGQPLQDVRVLDLSGRILAQARPGIAMWSFTLPRRGVFLVQAHTPQGPVTLRSTGI